MTQELIPTEATKTLTEESLKTRKKKLLISLDNCWAKCQACQEAGNLENLIRHQLPVKDSVGVEFYGAFRYVYFCSTTCLMTDKR